MKAYITKYALTQGIFEVEGEAAGNIFEADKGNRRTRITMAEQESK